MKHFSHPHALKELVKNQEDDEIICSGCEKQLSSDEPAYKCPKRDCEFFLHKSCFELPRKIELKSHHKHSLNLLSEPPEFSIYYDCNACGELINGFSFNCKKCDFKLHVKCAFMPENVDCKAHKHALAVRHVTPKSSKDWFGGLVVCDVCDKYVSDAYWSYFCKDCDFCTNLECAFTAKEHVEPEEEEEDKEEENEEKNEEENEEKEEHKEEENDEEEQEEEEDEEGLSDAARLARANIKAMDQMALLQFQMQMAQLNARTTAMLFRSNF